MDLLTWLEFLLGSERGIRLAAGCDGLLLVGAVFVLTAGIARSWRRKLIAEEPWWLLLPFIASALSCFALTVVFSMSWFGISQLPYAVTKVFPVMLTCFWLMAPMAWLYGLPFDRIDGRSKAVTTRLLMLLFVSVWRVALTVQIVAVLFDAPTQVAFVNVMFFSAIVALVAIYVAGKSLKRIEGAPFIIGLMGGIETKQLRHHKQLQEVAGCVKPVIVIGGIIFLIAWLFSFQSPSHALPDEIGISAIVQPSLFITAGVALLTWIGFAWHGQRMQNRARNIDQLIDSNRIAEAAQILSEFEQEDFLGDWSPLRGQLTGVAPLGRLLAFIDESQKRPGWVQEEGQKLVVQLIDDPLLYWFQDRNVEDVLKRLPNWEVNPELAAGALQQLSFIRFNLEEGNVANEEASKRQFEHPEYRGIISQWPPMTPARRQLANHLKKFAGDLFTPKAHDIGESEELET